MASLTDMQQRFVIAMLDLGNGNYSDAYRAAGYASDNPDSVKANAYQTAHRPNVQEALREEAKKRLNGASAMALNKLIQMAAGALDSINEDGEHVVAPVDQKTQLKAIEMVMNRGGLQAVTEQKITVEHKSDEEQVARIKDLARTLGLDPRALLGRAGVVVDADFSIVPDAKA
jgi:hypothetical protein